MQQSMYACMLVAMVSRPDVCCDLHLRVGFVLMRRHCNRRKEAHFDCVARPEEGKQIAC